MCDICSLFEIFIFSQNLACGLASEFSLWNQACELSYMTFINNIQKQSICTAAAEITRVLTTELPFLFNRNAGLAVPPLF